MPLGCRIPPERPRRYSCALPRCGIELPDGVTVVRADGGRRELPGEVVTAAIPDSLECAEVAVSLFRRGRRENVQDDEREHSVLDRARNGCGAEAGDTCCRACIRRGASFSPLNRLDSRSDVIGRYIGIPLDQIALATRTR